MKNTINKIILFAAFAAGLSNISANAQVATEAEATVYDTTNAASFFNPDTSTFEQVPTTIAIDEIYDGLQAITGEPIGNYFDLLDENRQIITDDVATEGPNGYPAFDGVEITGGELLRFFGTGTDYTVRVYTDGTDLFIAAGEGRTTTPAVAPFTANSVGGNLFWINSNTNRRATVISADLYGFVDAVCDPGYVLQPDRISCALPPPLNCGRGTLGGDFDNDGRCDCADDAQFRVDAESCRAATNLQECIDEGYMYRDTRDGNSICTDTAPPPTCGTGTTGILNAQNECECTDNTHNRITDTATNTQTCEAPPPPNCDTTTTELNTGTNMCDCRTGFSGRVSPTMCERNAADCTGATPVLFNGICVAACESDEARNAAGNCVPNPANCEANAITNPDDDMNCICIDDMHRFVAGSTTACEPIPANPNTPTCEEHQMLNSSNECVNRTAENCGNMQVFEPASSGGGVCTSAENFLNAENIAAADSYTAESCESAGWAVSIAINNEKTAAAEVCGIPVVRDDTADDSATAAAANAETAAAAESVPLQFPENENANGCIIRESADFLTLPDCNDSQLFGNGGFPQMPESFDVATDRLTIAFVADGENQIFFNGENITESDPPQPPPPTTNTPITGGGGGSTGDDRSGVDPVPGVALLGVGIAVMILAGGDFSLFSFSPDFGYRITESGYAANAGGRMDFRKDNWHFYTTVKQQNTNGDFGDFRYASGGKYTADFWTAAFSESVAGETADYDFSLSANLRGGNWNISPVYRMHSEYEKGETETRNELNLQGNFRYNNWQIRPAAGFRWRQLGEFSENARFQINAVHRF